MHPIAILGGQGGLGARKLRQAPVSWPYPGEVECLLHSGGKKLASLTHEGSEAGHIMSDGVEHDHHDKYRKEYNSASEKNGSAPARRDGGGKRAGTTAGRGSDGVSCFAERIGVKGIHDLRLSQLTSKAVPLSRWANHVHNIRVSRGRSSINERARDHLSEEMRDIRRRMRLRNMQGRSPVPNPNAYKQYAKLS
jgi:hypothetical protein